MLLQQEDPDAVTSRKAPGTRERSSSKAAEAHTQVLAEKPARCEGAHMPALVRCHPLTHMQPEEPERSPLEASGDSAPPAQDTPHLRYPRN